MTPYTKRPPSNPDLHDAWIEAERDHYRRIESRTAVTLLERRLKRAGQHVAAEVLRFLAFTGGAGLGCYTVGALLGTVRDALNPIVFGGRLNAEELAALGRFNRGIAEWASDVPAPPPVAGNLCSSTVRARPLSHPDEAQTHA